MMSVEKIMSDAKATVTTGLRGKGKLTAVGMKKWFQYNRNAIVKNATETSKRPEKQSGYLLPQCDDVRGLSPVPL